MAKHDDRVLKDTLRPPTTSSLTAEEAVRRAMQTGRAPAAKKRSATTRRLNGEGTSNSAAKRLTRTH